jgi:hypothetical protein
MLDTMGRVSRRLGPLVALLLVVTFAQVTSPPGVAAASLPTFQHLTPGRAVEAHQDVPVTVVLVGFHATTGATAVDPARLLASQQSMVRPVDRTTHYLASVGIPGFDVESPELGLVHDLRYRVVAADQAFEDALFGYLPSIAFGPLPPTVFQSAYSADPLAAQHITANWVIDAARAEQWLAANAGPMLGVDTTRPTMFILNWFGRPDFRFHTYGFLSTRPGHDHPVGVTQPGQMVAFGGSTTDAPYGTIDRLSRVWFYDLSAGPDYGTGSWLLSPPDFNGDGQTDNRIPPIWEYGTNHWYRPFDDLTADLAKIVRYVGVDILFAPSSIYDPALSEPLLPTNVELDLNFFAGVAGRDPRSLVRLADVSRSFSLLDPTRTYPTDPSVFPLTGEIARVFDCQQTAFTATPTSCYGGRVKTPLTAFYDLDVYFLDQESHYLDGTRYEVPVAVFDVPNARLAPGSLLGLSSYQPPNLQGWSYLWLADRFRSQGFDDTATVVHEVGHHLGLVHYHDTFDAGVGEDLDWNQGAFFFLAVGDELNSTMSYIPNTNEFGQFDRDRMARWQLAARLDNANRILGDIVRSPRAGRAADTLAAADAKAGEALTLLQSWDLPGASRAAADAYDLVRRAAGQAGVAVEPWSGTADQNGGVGSIRAGEDTQDIRPKPVSP